jgi:hypothetical protein
VKGAGLNSQRRPNFNMIGATTSELEQARSGSPMSTDEHDVTSNDELPIVDVEAVRVERFR